MLYNDRHIFAFIMYFYLINHLSYLHLLLFVNVLFNSMNIYADNQNIYK